MQNILTDVIIPKKCTLEKSEQSVT
jgi:hypothetical protein